MVELTPQLHATIPSAMLGSTRSVELEEMLTVRFCSLNDVACILEYTKHRLTEKQMDDLNACVTLGNGRSNLRRITDSTGMGQPDCTIAPVCK